MTGTDKSCRGAVLVGPDGRAVREYMGAPPTLSLIAVARGWRIIPTLEYLQRINARIATGDYSGRV